MTHVNAATGAVAGRGHAGQWFLVLAKPSAEAKARVNLERQGYRVYYPRLVRPMFCRGRWVDRIVALFPRYLFLSIDVGAQALAPVRSTLGVADIVRFGPEYAQVPESIVTDLVHRADPVTGLHRLNRDRSFRPGAPVRVIAGAFSGCDGIYECDAGADRVVVLLSLLGQSTRARMSSEFIVPQLASCA
jgi:transcriptional antiterminator RfaH